MSEEKPVEKTPELPWHDIVIQSNGVSWKVVPPVNIFELKEIARMLLESDKK